MKEFEYKVGDVVYNKILKKTFTIKKIINYNYDIFSDVYFFDVEVEFYKLIIFDGLNEIYNFGRNDHQYLYFEKYFYTKKEMKKYKLEKLREIK